MTLPFLSDLSFVHPWFLLGLLLIPILSLLKGRFGGNAGVIFSSTKTLEKLGKQRRSRAGDFLTSLIYLAFACLILALARPQKGQTLTHINASGVDIVLAIDVSRSMLAEDFSIGSARANRLEVVKKVTEEFIRRRPNDRIGLVAFAGRPYVVSPLTLDHDWLIQNLERIRIGLVEDGTAIGSALASSANRLKDKEAKSKLIVLLSDGENNAGTVAPLTAAEAAKALNVRVYTVGAGSEGPVPFPVGQDPFGQTIYRRADLGFDETALKEIAKLTGGSYYRATDTKSLEKIFDQIDQLEKTEIKVEKYAQYHDLFAWLLLAGFGFLVVEVILSQTAWRHLP